MSNDDEDPLAFVDKAAIRRLTARYAETPDDERMLLAMLGVTPSTTDEVVDGPPDNLCAAPDCRQKMHRRNWPPAWQEGRRPYGANGKCVSCRRKERVAAGEAAPRNRGKPGRPKSYRRKTG